MPQFPRAVSHKVLVLNGSSKFVNLSRIFDVFATVLSSRMLASNAVYCYTDRLMTLDNRLTACTCAPIRRASLKKKKAYGHLHVCLFIFYLWSPVMPKLPI